MIKICTALHFEAAKRTDDNHVHLSIIIYSTFVCTVPYIRKSDFFLEEGY